MIDPKPRTRVRNRLLLHALHYRWRECALCGATDPLSLHHILKHPRDDVEANLIMLCGDGVRGCHGRIESHHAPTEAALVNYILSARSDTVFYLRMTLGLDAAADWIQLRMS